MTIPEIERAIGSYSRIKKREAQEKATYDYILADLIGRSVSRIYSSSNTMPEISEAYPTLFDSEDIKQKKQAKQAELSVLRFKHFADSYNKKFQEVQRVKNE